MKGATNPLVVGDHVGPGGGTGGVDAVGPHAGVEGPGGGPRLVPVTLQPPTG